MDIAHAIMLLQKKGLTQKQIGLSIGRTQSSISHALTGKYGIKRPSSKVVDGLRKLLAENGLTEIIYQTEYQDTHIYF